MLYVELHDLLGCWSGHFQSIFTANRNVQDTVIHRIPILPLKQGPDEPPTLQETTEAIARIQCHKAGVGCILPEILKFGGLMLYVELHDLLVCWSGHFQSLFTANRNVQDTVIHRIPILPLKQGPDEPPTLQETTEAIACIQCHKAGVGCILPEILKFGGLMLYVELHDLLGCCWKQGKLLQDYVDAVSMTLYRNMGEMTVCTNYRVITLKSLAGKVLAEVRHNWLTRTIVEENFPESQCGIGANRRTTDMVFILCQLLEIPTTRQRTLCYLCRPHESF